MDKYMWAQFGKNVTKLNRKVLVTENIFKVYPNPTKGLLSVVNPYNAPIRYQVISSIGQLMQSGEVESLLDVSNLNSGMYFLFFEKNDIREVVRVVKH